MNLGRRPTHKILVKLSREYGINPEWLVADETNMLLADQPIKVVPDKEGPMRDELRDILLEISLGDPAEADRVIAILKAYLKK